MNKRRNMLLYAIIALALLFLPWLANTYRLHLVIVALIHILMSAGLNLILGYFGEMSLGHAAFFGIGAYATALAALKFGCSMPVSILAGALCATLLGWLVAFLCLRVRGPYFVIVTLSVASILHIVAINWVNVTNGPMGLMGLRAPVLELGSVSLSFSNKVVFYYLMILLVGSWLLVINRLINSHVGRAWIAIREHEELASSIGVNRYAFGLCAVMLAAAMAGLGGGLYAFYISIVSPDVFAFSFMIIWLIMVITGGKGTMWGPVLGSVLFTVIPELLRAVDTYRLVIFGIVLLLVTLFMPQGILPMITRLLEGYSNRTPRIKVVDGGADGGANLHRKD